MLDILELSQGKLVDGAGVAAQQNNKTAVAYSAADKYAKGSYRGLSMYLARAKNILANPTARGYQKQLQP